MSTLQERERQLYILRGSPEMEISAYRNSSRIPLIPNMKMEEMITINVPPALITMIEAYLPTLGQEDQLFVTVSFNAHVGVRKTYQGLRVTMGGKREE